jgi:hypothetical protein
VGLAVAVATIGILDRPRLWAPPPDFLTLADRLGDLGSSSDPFLVGFGEGMPYEPVELQAWHGDRIRVSVDSGFGLPGTTDIRIEHLPERIDMYENTGVVIGTYAVFGHAAPRLAGEPCTGCDGWISLDERADTSSVTPGPYIAVRFTGDDPGPGDEALIYKDIAPAAGEREGSIRLRWLYGTLGLNTGRIRVELRLDGGTVWSEDIAAPRRWVRIPFVVTAAGARIEVAVVAQPGIEEGWEWGRASAVLIGELKLETP